MRPLFASLLVVAACGGDDGGSTIDAPGGSDGPPGIDAPPGQPDAPMFDAVPSTVTVVADACASTPAATLSAANLAFSTTNITINAGESVEFTTTQNHNFANAAAAPPQFHFRSGPTAGHTACLTFTMATGGPIGFRCEAHPGMTGTITVN